MNLEQLKVVFFDMDGVLYDSMTNHAKTWVQAFQFYGIEFTEEEAYLNEGRTGDSTVECAVEKYLGRKATLADKTDIYQKKCELIKGREDAPVFEGMPELIQFLRSKNIAVWIVTGSKQGVLLDRVWNDFGVSAHEIISGNDVVHGKPNPEPYLKALERSGFQASEAIVVENAPLGVQSACAAGITTYALNTGVLSDAVLLESGAKKVFNSGVAFFEWIKSL